jgi:hypothetical protein
MKKNKIIIIALSMVMIGTGIFIACQKEIDVLDNNSEKIEKFQKAAGDPFTFAVAQKQNGTKQGTWPNKFCAGTEGDCWLWFREWDTVSTRGYIVLTIHFEIIKNNSNSISMSIDLDKEGNDSASLEGIVDFDSHLLKIQDDIFEDSPVFLELMETENVVKIIAGDYPYVQYGSIITATVPVEIQTYLPE